MIRSMPLGNYNEAYKAVGKQKRDILLIWGSDDAEVTQEMINGVMSFIPGIKFIHKKNKCTKKSHY